MATNGRSRAAGHLKRLARLAEILLGQKFRGAEGFWTLQLQLLELQRAIQADIGKAKQTPPSAERAEELTQLRAVLKNSRRFGDSIAWLVLGLDRRVLYPLSTNQPNPVLPENERSNLLLDAASKFLAEDFGFPVLHDITDTLRIGDVTFVKPDRPPVTMEVKTVRLGQSTDADGTQSINYRLTATYLLPEDDAAALAGIGALAGSTKPRKHRADRQLDRMRQAQFHRVLPDDLPTKMDGELFAATSINGRADSHFSLIKRLIRRARRDGISAAAADPDFAFLAIYSGAGLDSEPAIASLGALELDSVVMPILGGDDRDSLLLSSVPPDEDLRGPQLYLPYFLLSFPRRWVLDMALGRLAVVTFWNPARLAPKLEAEGFKVVLRTRAPSYPELVAGWRHDDDLGNEAWYEVRGLDNLILEMLMEFKGTDHIVESLKAMTRIVETIHEDPKPA